MSSAITPLIMPKWGLEMREGTIAGWLVEVGDRITVGMPVLDVETDKISNAVEAPDAGLLRRKVAKDGETLAVRALLGVLAEPEVSESDIDAYIANFAAPESHAQSESDSAAFDSVEVAGIRIRFAKRGPDDAETVVLLHGFGGDLGNWLFNIDTLAEQFRVFALDLPAHGGSQVKLPGHGLQGLASFVRAWLDQLELRQVHLIGHSLGAAIASSIALEDAQRVKSLCLICPAGLGAEINASYVEGFVNAESRRELKPVVEKLFHDPSLVTRSLLEDLLKYKRIDGVSQALHELQKALFNQGAQAEQPILKLSPAQHPLLILWGESDQVIASAQAKLAPEGSTVHILEGAGHMVMLEKASEVNQLMKEHLKRHSN